MVTGFGEWSVHDVGVAGDERGRRHVREHVVLVQVVEDHPVRGGHLAGTHWPWAMPFACRWYRQSKQRWRTGLMGLGTYSVDWSATRSWYQRSRPSVNECSFLQRLTVIRPIDGYRAPPRQR